MPDILPSIINYHTSCLKETYAKKRMTDVFSCGGTKVMVDRMEQYVIKKPDA